MAEYIDKQELLKNFCGYDLTRCKKYGNETPEQQSQSICTLMMYEIAMEIEDAPAADVRPERHGHWVAKEFSERGYSKHYTYTNYFCSECGRRLKGYSSPSDAPYCHCGAKMDGEDGKA